ncbi:MAG: DoxX family protein [Kiritimatiellia bacterium]|jgi:putative oxidoreductase|nr:DoxX family protein [Kiritimatiellia bacterium]
MTTKKYLIGADSDANLGLLILRVFIGAALLTHGWGKMFGGLSDYAASVGQMRLPFPQVLGFLSAFAESIAAILLAIGLLTRPAAALIVINMAVAALAVHGGQGFAAQELAWLYFAPALFFLLKGAGKWSLDYQLSHRG